MIQHQIGRRLGMVRGRVRADRLALIILQSKARRKALFSKRPKKVSKVFRLAGVRGHGGGGEKFLRERISHLNDLLVKMSLHYYDIEMSVAECT